LESAGLASQKAVRCCAGNVVFAGAKKNRSARLRRGGFPYNLMKSHKSGGQCLPLPFCSPPLSFIDDTKVQDTRPVAKDKNRRLLRKNLAVYLRKTMFMIFLKI